MKENKELYVIPAISIVELKQEGVICASGLGDPADYPSVTDPFGF